MLTKGSVEDAISFYLSRLAPGRNRSGLEGAAGVSKKVPELGKRVFLSDWELKRAISPGQKTVAVPVNAIISPLSSDWLEYDGVEIVRGRKN